MALLVPAFRLCGAESSSSLKSGLYRGEEKGDDCREEAKGSGAGIAAGREWDVRQGGRE